MQSTFDEYRTTAEFLFNAEIAKLEDELSSQAARYEQEIMYVIQAKDKFYADMMVAKDAKIMNLIEGSDLQNLMQKHEMVCLTWIRSRLLPTDFAYRISKISEKNTLVKLNTSKHPKNPSKRTSCRSYNAKTSRSNPNATNYRRISKHSKGASRTLWLP